MALRRLLRGPGHLPLGAAAQRVLAGVEVLDLRLLVAVAGRAELVLPGVRVLGAAAGLPGGTGGITAVGSAAPDGPVCGRTLVAALGS